MQRGTRHLVGAAMIVNLLVFGQTGSAQDCPGCQVGSADAYGQEGCAPDECTTNGCVHGSCQNFDGCCAGNRDGFDPHCRPCKGKACYAYRPFTEASQPDLFYNYYVPNNQGSAAAAYPAPFPTPSLIGHTYYTYQPLMPHEFLYTHRRTYHQYYNGGMGLNRTKVRWYRTPVKTALKDVGGSVGWFLGNLHR